MLHGGALEYGSSKNPTTALATHAWHPLRVYKQSGFDSRLRPQNCLRSSNVEQPVLTRTRVGSSPTGGTRQNELESIVLQVCYRKGCLHAEGAGRNFLTACTRIVFSRCSSVWIERSLWEREVGGSNPLTLTSYRADVPSRPAGDRAVADGNDESTLRSA